MAVRIAPGLPIGTIGAWVALYEQVSTNSGGYPAVGAMLVWDAGQLYWSAVA